MILSHRYRFIFLKTNKTAGTSIEIALSKHCGPDDIVTPISPPDERLRQEHGGRNPQHYLPAIRQYSARDWLTAIARGRRKRFFNHMPARLVKRLVGDEIWNNYYKFCVERNPWDRVLSLYAWRCQQEPRPTLSQFLQSAVPRDLQRRGIDVYSIGGQPAVDRICRYEHLADDLEAVRRHLGMPEPLELPRAKASFRVDRRHYREIYSPHERDQVAELFRREIESLGYTF